MSVTVSTPAQICNSPVNNSRAKMLFTIPKATKEMSIKKSDCNKAFYDLPEVRATRTAGFGYGTKLDFTKSSANNPPPNTYEIKSAFEGNKKRGFSFGLSREAMQVTGCQFVGEKKSPGPAAYDIRESNKSKISFSFRPRTTIEALVSPKYVPGPGTYPVPQSINERGNYFNSKFSGSKATLFSPPRSKRFIELKPGYPGPGTYDNPQSLNPDGSYFVSKFKSSFCRTFSHGMRKDASNPSFVGTPGPGSYKLPSEFGHYESSKIQNKTTTN
jgi:hypothetical protein